MALWRRTAGPQTNPDDVRMTLGEHLEELRTRLIRAILALGIGAVLCFIFSEELVLFLCAPIFAILEEQGYSREMTFLGPAENLMMYLKVSIIVGFILTAPYSLMQIWGFIAAGLYPHERKWVRRFAPASIILFFVGALFLLVFVSPVLYRFLLSYQTQLPDRQWVLPMFRANREEPRIKTTEDHNGPPASQALQPETATKPVIWPDLDLPRLPSFEQDPEAPPEGVLWLNKTTGRLHVRFGDKTYSLGPLTDVAGGPRIRPDIRISENITFVLELSAAFGITFQIPVVVAFLAAVGMVSSAQMSGMRRYVWFGMAIAAAIVTPTTDPVSMMLMMLPMVLLFEIGLWVARILEKGRVSKGQNPEAPVPRGD